LAALIAGCDAVVAHRLHAAIVAYAYRVPTVGLLWDDKLQAFFESVGREAYVVAFDQAPARIGALVADAMAEGIDADEHTRVLQETGRGIDDLVRAITGHTCAPAEDARVRPGGHLRQEPAGSARGAVRKWMGAA
jgi:hypothetical protein